MNKKDANLPLVYSCSGCSNVAQLANDLAVTLDREGHAQMSCIAGVGGNVKNLVKTAKSDRPILAIDGCKVACVKKVLERHRIVPQWHMELTELGIKKRDHEACSPSDMYKSLAAAHKLLSSI
ncbi:putative zinc-binding protein [Cellvibrio sp. QJXJ]|uniref:putative zinc-binding protein n=1 Tax=Cellvibrio sp. QJXJ TaxID=2964606 RepID=UPI0021C46190|nr:putative zinc-binding protein [Cellvibrio sp. QJXJ]UUA75032.1 putative zinc-binding protein [Cellvibrio sp. QJXJ]